MTDEPEGLSVRLTQRVAVTALAFAIGAGSTTSEPVDGVNVAVVADSATVAVSLLVMVRMTLLPVTNGSAVTLMYSVVLFVRPP